VTVGDGVDNDDLEAQLVDPVLVEARTDPVAPSAVAAVPEVWGMLAAGPGDGDPTTSEPTDDDIEARARALVDEMTLHEKLHLLSGDGELVRGLAEMARRYNARPYVAGEVPRLGIPGIRFTDGPRGVVMGHATAFPVAMARAATFDPDLEERVGDAIGVECRALGANLFAGVCVNVLRHPAWGRAQETFGEDPHLLGEMGAALVRGTQRHVMACVKHLACNSMEDARMRVDVSIDEADLREIYLPAFRRCVDEGVAAVMTAYNKVNGQRCGHHEHLVSRILKGEWGFDGFVMSDFVFGVRSGMAVAAGLDLEMPFRWRFRSLERLVRRGRLSTERTDDAALRLVRQQVRFAARTGTGATDRHSPTRVAGDEHRALARLVAERSAVLLRNEPVVAPGIPAASTLTADDARAPLLPLDPDQVQSLAVLGHLAAEPVTGDRGSSHVHARGVVTLLDGLREAGERFVVKVEHQPGRDLRAAQLAASRADVAVVVVGSTGEGEKLPGRGGDRRELTLAAIDERLVRTVAAANPRTIVVLLGGGPIVCESWIGQVPAVLMAWYPGIEGGTAVVRLLVGEVSPGGRLPCTWPRSAEQLPPFDPDARAVRYGPLHGYRLMEATDRSPAFAFGFGLTYTTFDRGRITAVRRVDGDVRVTVPVVNTGLRTGDEVVQLYVDEALGSEPRPLRTLRAARRVTVTPGQLRDVTVDLSPDLLARTPRTADGKVRIHVGSSADPATHHTVEV
jgi:beta-glucosidase